MYSFQSNNYNKSGVLTDAQKDSSQSSGKEKYQRERPYHSPTGQQLLGWYEATDLREQQIYADRN